MMNSALSSSTNTSSQPPLTRQITRASSLPVATLVNEDASKAKSSKSSGLFGRSSSKLKVSPKGKLVQSKSVSGSITGGCSVVSGCLKSAPISQSLPHDSVSLTAKQHSLKKICSSQEYSDGKFISRTLLEDPSGNQMPSAQMPDQPSQRLGLLNARQLQDNSFRKQHPFGGRAQPKQIPDTRLNREYGRPRSDSHIATCVQQQESSLRPVKPAQSIPSGPYHAELINPPAQRYRVSVSASPQDNRLQQMYQARRASSERLFQNTNVRSLDGRTIIDARPQTRRGESDETDLNRYFQQSVKFSQEPDLDSYRTSGLTRTLVSSKTQARGQHHEHQAENRRHQMPESRVLNSERQISPSYRNPTSSAFVACSRTNSCHQVIAPSRSRPAQPVHPVVRQYERGNFARKSQAGSGSKPIDTQINGQFSQSHLNLSQRTNLSERQRINLNQHSLS